MKYEIDKELGYLTLNGDYHIEFDRLTEAFDDYTWFNHLCEKPWVDMLILFDAFIEAYRAANIPLKQEFFDNFKDCLVHRAKWDFENKIDRLWEKRFGDGKLIIQAADIKTRSLEKLMEDIVSDESLRTNKEGTLDDQG
jgi:hypothetical protein